MEFFKKLTQDGAFDGVTMSSEQSMLIGFNRMFGFGDLVAESNIQKVQVRKLIMINHSMAAMLEWIGEKGFGYSERSSDGEWFWDAKQKIMDEIQNIDLLAERGEYDKIVYPEYLNMLAKALLEPDYAKDPDNLEEEAEAANRELQARREKEGIPYLPECRYKQLLHNHLQEKKAIDANYSIKNLFSDWYHLVRAEKENALSEKNLSVFFPGAGDKSIFANFQNEYEDLLHKPNSFWEMVMSFHQTSQRLQAKEETYVRGQDPFVLLFCHLNNVISMFLLDIQFTNESLLKMLQAVREKTDLLLNVAETESKIESKDEEEKKDSQTIQMLKSGFFSFISTFKHFMEAKNELVELILRLIYDLLLPRTDYEESLQSLAILGKAVFENIRSKHAQDTEGKAPEKPVERLDNTIQTAVTLISTLAKQLLNERGSVQLAPRFVKQLDEGIQQLMK